MDCFNFVIVGTGPAGVSAARRLENMGACLIDAGDTPGEEFPYETLAEGLSASDCAAMLGSQLEIMSNLPGFDRVHSKLRLPAVSYVARGDPFELWYGEDRLLHGSSSHAVGGFSNAWGGQLLRYTDADLIEAGSWPVDAGVFSAYYADLERHIGISGAEDDLAEYFGGSMATMLPPVPMVPAAERLLECYRRARPRNGTVQHQLLLGRPRLGLLTTPYRGYLPHGFGELEFFSTRGDQLYTASRTLREVLARGKLRYLSGQKLLRFRESVDYVELELRSKGGGDPYRLRAKQLLIGCGTLGTAKVVLTSKEGRGQPVPFMDHPPFLLPLFLPGLFGGALPPRSYPIQLAGMLKGQQQNLMLSFYYPGGLLLSDLVRDLPLPLSAAIKMLPIIMGGMLVAQGWTVTRPHVENSLRLDGDDTIRINYPIRDAVPELKTLVRELRRLCAVTHLRLTQFAAPGWGFHYAGCFPMRRDPQRFETHLDGRLWDSKRVRLIDGSVFPSLPAKNLSLTIMANAARIADEAIKCAC